MDTIWYKFIMYHIVSVCQEFTAINIISHWYHYNRTVTAPPVLSSPFFHLSWQYGGKMLHATCQSHAQSPVQAYPRSQVPAVLLCDRMDVFPVTLSDRKPNQYTACKRKNCSNGAAPFLLSVSSSFLWIFHFLLCFLRISRPSFWPFRTLTLPLFLL